MRARKPKFLVLAQVMRAHRSSLEAHGGLDGVRDAGAIEAALGSAQNTWFYGSGDFYDVAAAYAFHLAESQAFLDGNKRTAVMAALIFLQLNHAYVRPNQEELYSAMIAIARRQMTKAELAQVFRSQRLAKLTD